MYNQPLRPDELMHYGVLGMKWGVRRYQNKDGTLTAAGKARIKGIDYSDSLKNIGRLRDSLNHLIHQKTRMEIKSEGFQRKAGKLKDKNLNKSNKYIELGQEYANRSKEIDNMIKKLKVKASENGYKDFIKYGSMTEKDRHMYNGKQAVFQLMGMLLGPIGFVASSVGTYAYVKKYAPERIRDVEKYDTKYYEMYKKLMDEYQNRTIASSKAKKEYDALRRGRMAQQQIMEQQIIQQQQQMMHQQMMMNHF